MAVFDWRQTLGAGEISHPVAISDFHVSGSGAGAVLYAATLGNGGVSAFASTLAGGIVETGSTAYPVQALAGVSPEIAILPGGVGGTLAVSGLPPGGPGLSPAGVPGAWTSLSGWPEALRAAEFATAGGNGFLLTGQSNGALASLEWAGDALSFRAALPGLAPSDIAQGADGTVFALSAATDSVTAVSLSAGGALAPLLTVGAADGLGWAAPSAIAPVTAGGDEFLIVGSPGSSALTVLAFRHGTFEVRDHVIDDLATRFAGVPALDTISINGRGFVAAGGADDGMTLFEVLPDGRLVAIETIADGATTTLANVNAVALIDWGAWLQLVVAAQGEPGLTMFATSASAIGAPRIGTAGADALTGGGADDLLFGGAGDDTLSGGAGRDVLSDGNGSDVMRGGSGADVFVLTRDGRPDTIADFEPGLDRLDLSGFPGLYALEDLSVTPTATGARLSFGGEVVDVVTASKTSLERGMLSTSDIVGVTRPPLIPIGRDVTGSPSGDTLEGAFAPDRIRGFEGDDNLSGRDGGDLMGGGAGADTLDGGTGADRLFGDEGFDGLLGRDGPDLLFGGADDDNLDGGTGGDLLVGGAGNDTLDGAEGNDTLRGGRGDDALSGDDGVDRLYGGDGADALDGGGGRDWLDGGAGADILTGGLGADVFVFVEGFGADTVADFEIGVTAEVIDLSRHSGAGSWKTVSDHLSDGPDGAVIDLGSGDALTLAGVDAASLGPGDFLFWTA